MHSTQDNSLPDLLLFIIMLTPSMFVFIGAVIIGAIIAKLLLPKRGDDDDLP